MDYLFYKTFKIWREKRDCIKRAGRIKRFSICFPIRIREFFCSLRYLSHFIKSTPYIGFASVTPRDQNGVWQASYSTYLKYKKNSILIAIVFLTVLGLAISLFVFSVHPSKVLAAPTPCVTPYTVLITAPASNIEVCAGDTFIMTGKWSDSGGACLIEEPMYGKIGSTTISMITHISVSSGTFYETKLEDSNFTKTVTASNTGTHNIKFMVDALSTGEPYPSYSSSIRTITVNPHVNWGSTTLSHSDNTSSTITWAWDNISNEDNYRIQDTGNNNMSGDLAADTESWQESSLDANTQYTRYAQAENTCGTDNTANTSVYTSIESPTGISFDSVGQNAIRVSGSGSVSNLASGSSGIKFTESITSTNSDWIQTNSWEKTGLTANKQYSFNAQTRNGDSDENSTIGTETKYTLATDANVSSDGTENVWSTDTNYVFTNGVNFGEGGVEYYRYIFNKNSAHTFDNTETQWTSGTKTLTASSDGSWYLHAKAFNSDDVAADSGASTTLGPFKIDTTSANVSNINVNQTIDSATIAWITSEATTTQIAWGVTDSYGNLTQENTELATSHSVTLLGLNDDTTYHYKIMGDDQVGNATASADHSFATSELEATVITNVQVTEISTTSVKITWTTNHAADSKVRYGLTTAYGQEVYESDSVTSHEITLTGLTTGTTYHYEVLSTGNTTTYDADATFATESEEEEEKDEEMVYVASPTVVKTEVNPIEDGAVINEVSPTITGLARANNTIFIFIDGELEQTVLSTNHDSGTGSFAYQLRRILPEGEHTLYTISRDVDGNYSDRSPIITFTVDHPFVAPTLYEPVFTDGDDPTVSINGVARNDSLIKVYIDGEYCGEFEVKNNSVYENTYFNYQYSISSLNVGEHVISTKAFSSEGEASKFSNSYTLEKKISTAGDEQFIFSDSIKYTVLPGDSLWKIAERFYGNGTLYNQIIEVNKEAYPSLLTNPGVIQSDWNLVIP